MGNISLGTFIPSKADSKMELEHVRLNGPLDVYYVPEYLSTAQEESLLERLSASRSWVASIRGRR